MPHVFVIRGDITHLAFDAWMPNADRAKAILHALDPATTRPKDPAFAWPRDLHPGAWHEYRWSAQGDERDVQRVSPVELANAMRHIAEESAGIAEGPLLREVLARFGAKRLTEDVAAHLRAGLDVGLALGKVARTPTGTIVAG